MKPNLTYLLIIIGLLTSCSSSDDNNSNNSAIEASNFTTAITEHPEANASLGAIEANSNTELTFTISSQNPEGAVQINNLGELTVLDASLFDFELNPQVTAQIEIANASTSTTIQATINLTDIDDIAHYLTDSKQTYIDANAEQWILVTEAEYNMLAQNLISVSLVGTTNEMFNASAVDGADIFYDDNILGHNLNGLNIPEDSYVFAFKYVSGDNGVAGARVKVSSVGELEGYQNLGGELPTHPNKDQYFVLKGSALTNGSFMAFYSPLAIGYMSPMDGQNDFWFTESNSETLTLDEFGYLLYQGLSTDKKQWD